MTQRNNAKLPENILNSKRTTYEIRRCQDLEMNFLYEDITKDYSGYDEEEYVEIGSDSCYRVIE